MEPRFIIKTHTGALRPANYSLLIAKCTYPDRGSYPEVVVKKLQEGISAKSVARFTVLLSTTKNRGFGFLLDNMIWSWKGHVINTVLSYLGKRDNEDISTYEELTKLEKICYLRYFLETEGAIILKLAERLHKMREASYSYLKENIKRIFDEIISGYIEIAPDFRARSRIRNLESQIKSQMRSKADYDEDIKAHKIRPHIQALHDLGLILVERKETGEVYVPRYFDSTSTASVITNVLRDLGNMEDLFFKYAYFSVISQVYNLMPIPYAAEAHGRLLREAVSYGYEIMRAKVTGMADINALIDWASMKLLSEDNVLIERVDVDNCFEEIRREEPSKIQYHVDGKGRIAYLVLSRAL